MSKIRTTVNLAVAGLEWVIFGALVAAFAAAITAWAYYREEYWRKSKVRLAYREGCPRYEVDLDHNRIIMSGFEGSLTKTRGSGPVYLEGIFFASPPPILQQEGYLGSLFVFPDETAQAFKVRLDSDWYELGYDDTDPADPVLRKPGLTENSAHHFKRFDPIEIPFHTDVIRVLDEARRSGNTGALDRQQRILEDAAGLMAQTHRVLIQASIGDENTESYYWIGKRPKIRKAAGTVSYTVRKKVKKDFKEFFGLD